VFSLRAQYLGEFVKGYFWDRSGRAVAFVKGARGGPMPPMQQLPSLPPLHPLTPMRPMAPMTPMPPMHSLGLGVA
jgi:hypothetical protein